VITYVLALSAEEGSPDLTNFKITG